jgi:SagB-type dehydrogenase family enzyme
VLLAVVALLAIFVTTNEAPMVQEEGGRIVSLPEPRLEGALSLEGALRARKSEREYSDAPVSLGEVSQLLWAAQGVTHSRAGYDMRTAPSAGALYPIELHLVAVRVDGLEAGHYRYRIGEHQLVEVSGEDRRRALTAAANDQDCVGDAAAVIVVTGVVARTAAKYGQRAERYVHMEVGAVAENVLLQATALGLGSVWVGAFNDRQLGEVLRLAEGEAAYAMLPVGRL